MQLIAMNHQFTVLIQLGIFKKIKAKKNIQSIFLLILIDKLIK